MELRQLFGKGGCEGKTYRGGTERQVFKDTKRYILRHKDIKNIFKRVFVLRLAPSVLFLLCFPFFV